MGWTIGPRDPSLSDLEYFRRHFGERVLDVESYRGVAYIAYRSSRIEKTVAVVCLTRRYGTDRFGNIKFGYKDMDEGMGLADTEAQCPRLILEQLDEVTDEEDPQGWMRDWRRRCWARLGGKPAGEQLSLF